MSSFGQTIAKLDVVLKTIRRTASVQLTSSKAKAELQELCGIYFEYSASRADELGEAQHLHSLFRELHESSRKSPRKSRIISMLSAARESLVALESSELSSSARRGAGHKTAVDELIVTSLQDICPSAALAYSQALLDLGQQTRLSWRGPATDLREALREALDVLAQDHDVEAMPGFKLETNAHRPTMKQKVRYVLKNRGQASGAMATPEEAVKGVEEFVGSLTRSVYTRSSVSTHTPTDRAEVARVHAWVRLVLCELLEIPL